MTKVSGDKCVLASFMFGSVRQMSKRGMTRLAGIGNVTLKPGNLTTSSGKRRR
jgi:hypothetical protein